MGCGSRAWLALMRRNMTYRRRYWLSTVRCCTWNLDIFAMLHLLTRRFGNSFWKFSCLRSSLSFSS